MTHSTRFLLLGVFVAVGLFPCVDLQAADDVFLETRRSEFQKIPIWLMGFHDGNSQTRIGAQLHDVLKADLTRTQVFEVLEDPPDVPAFEHAHCQDDVPRAKARASGATVTTWGRIGKKRGRVVMDVCAYDGGENDLALGRHYTGTGKPITMTLLRTMVHRWANALVSHYTGDSGIALTKIVYVSRNHAGGPGDVYVMDYDGYGPKRVTNNRAMSLMPTWSPDRRSLLYTTYRRNNQEIVQLNLASGTQRILVPPDRSLNMTPAFAPGGQLLAYASANQGNSDIFALNVGTKETVQLTAHPGADLSPTWSPDGRKLAFTSDRGGRPQIYIMRRDGSRVRRLTFEGKDNAAPAWSPRGDWIAYVCAVRRMGFKLCRISPDGTRRVQITKGPRGEIDDSPSWAPDGRHLVFSSTRGGRSHIFMIAIDGTGLEQLTEDPKDAQGAKHYSSPAWSPS